MLSCEMNWKYLNSCNYELNHSKRYAPRYFCFETSCLTSQIIPPKFSYIYHQWKTLRLFRNNRSVSKLKAAKVFLYFLSAPNSSLVLFFQGLAVRAAAYQGTSWLWSLFLQPPWWYALDRVWSRRWWGSGRAKDTLWCPWNWWSRNRLQKPC